MGWIRSIRWVFLTVLIIGTLLLSCGALANGPPAEDHFYRGVDFYLSGDLDEAILELKLALKIDPEYDKAKRLLKIILEAKREEYIIGKDDLLEISVWRYEELTREVTVRPDGRISFPLIGDVEAEGLTTSQLDKKITEKLAVYVKEPKVTVIVKEFGGKVIVLGEVGRAGVYGIKGRFSLAEAIARAGGLTESAVSRSIVVIQGGLENPKISLVNLSKAMHKGGFTLRSGDVVYVPRSFIGNINFVLRQIIPSLSTVYYIDQLAE